MEDKSIKFYNNSLVSTIMESYIKQVNSEDLNDLVDLNMSYEALQQSSSSPVQTVKIEEKSLRKMETSKCKRKAAKFKLTLLAEKCRLCHACRSCTNNGKKLSNAYKAQVQLNEVLRKELERKIEELEANLKMILFAMNCIQKLECENNKFRIAAREHEENSKKRLKTIKVEVVRTEKAHVCTMTCLKSLVWSTATKFSAQVGSVLNPGNKLFRFIHTFCWMILPAVPPPRHFYLTQQNK
ncbi:uncharacterized protein LOC119685294 isoform X1 [Teleopsis dalmanni]|uniref:uncharacterized protein LOC119685294 isoform X1 n=1 Tax=Teleopsis dalmanni TaxID=139649 RepID=UPI0018CC8C4D|nr:uncharacterized protein LOC119685294 isoform X1 [Teleopsis dalmanni]